jgi:predicted amidohydrolase YtcJ
MKRILTAVALTCALLFILNSWTLSLSASETPRLSDPQTLRRPSETPGLSDSKTPDSPADVIFRNGNVYTGDESNPKAAAIAVRGSRIIFAGSNADSRAYEGKGTVIKDLGGNTVVPGLTDSHYHLMGVGEREVALNLEGTTSLEDFLARVKARVSQTKPGGWVTGMGWIETFWKPPVFPTRSDLDKIASNNPVFLRRADGHGGVANSAALKIAGIDKNTSNPFGGEILKDKATGEPTGMLLDNALARVEIHVPRRGQGSSEAAAESNEQVLLLGVKRSIDLGWCQIQNAGSTYSDIKLFEKLYRDGKIKLRIYNAAYGPGPDAARLLKEGAVINAFDSRFTMRAIKVVFDGALGSRGAALLEPYSDSETSGFLTQKEDALAPMLLEALRQGIQVETHAIGDRANRIILDLYERAFQTVRIGQRKVSDPRWRVEHAQIVSPADIPRFAKLGVIPSMQPSHAIGDLFFAPARLGQARLEGAYAWQSFIKSGSIIAGGSDAPVERGEPMIEFYAAVARKDKNGFSGEGWHPEQAVTREQALKMFTIWPAYAAFQEKDKGSIQAGKLADLTVLSADIMKIPEAEILKTLCVATIIGGEVVFSNR